MVEKCLDHNNGELKGQMNQKVKYFLLSLYLQQTLKRTIVSKIWVKIFT